MALTISVESKNTLPLPSVPSSFTGKAIQTALSGSELATYSVFSSGEKAMPFGLVISLVSSVSLPSLRQTIDAAEIQLLAGEAFLVLPTIRP